MNQCPGHRDLGGRNLGPMVVLGAQQLRTMVCWDWSEVVLGSALLTHSLRVQDCPFLKSGHLKISEILRV